MPVKLAALKNNTGTLYLSSFNHEHASRMYRQLPGVCNLREYHDSYLCFLL